MGGLCSMFLPLWGAAAFALRPDLWHYLLCPFFVTLVTTVTALVLLYEFAEGPQQALFEARGWPEWLCKGLGVALIPIEAAIVNIFVFLLLFGSVVSQIQEHVLKERGVDRKLLSQYGVEFTTDMGCIQGCLNGLFFTVFGLVLMVATLEVHVVPLVGQVLWVFANGWVRSWELVCELLPLIGYRSCGPQTEHVLRHFVSYAAFGGVAVVLEFIPFANILFMAGNAYGAALLFEGFVDEGCVGRDGLELLPTAEPTRQPSQLSRDSKESRGSREQWRVQRQFHREGSGRIQRQGSKRQGPFLEGA